MPILEITLIAKPGGVRNSSTSHRHSSSGGGSSLVAIAGGWCPHLTVPARSGLFGMDLGTQPIPCSSQQFKDLTLFFSLLPCVKMEATITEIVNVFIMASSAAGEGNSS